MSSRRHNSRGFTLVEVLLALGILAVALVALLTLRNRDVALQAQSRHLVTATALAKSKLEEISVIDGAHEGEQSGDFGEDYPAYRWTRVAAPAPLLGWMELHVEVSWPEGAREERVELVTYVKEE
ncbi:MAG: prepilin-type N-terminal cleavage/methylation domain-containing protein [Nitrospirota bacterium]